MYSPHALKPLLFTLSQYALAFLLVLIALGGQAQEPGTQEINRLEVPAIIRTTPDKAEHKQLFRGPLNSTKSWRLCVVLPNVSDKFWDEVVSGIREESARLGVTSIIYEASGYTDAGKTQQERILNQRCGSGDLDAVLLAAINSSSVNATVQRLRAQNILVIDFVNGYDSQEIDARAFLDNYYLGQTSGIEIKKYIATHLKNRTPNILWVPGPKGPNWAARGDQGFKDALQGTSANIETLHLTPHYREQNRDLRRHLKNGRTYDLIIGTGPTSVAVYQLKNEGIIPRNTPVFAYYTTPDALELLRQKQLIGAVSNEPKIQGRIGVALAVGLLEKLPMPFQVGPEPVLLKP